MPVSNRWSRDHVWIYNSSGISVSVISFRSVSVIQQTALASGYKFWKTSAGWPAGRAGPGRASRRRDVHRSPDTPRRRMSDWRTGLNEAPTLPARLTARQAYRPTRQGVAAWHASRAMQISGQSPCISAVDSRSTDRRSPSDYRGDATGRRHVTEVITEERKRRQIKRETTERRASQDARDQTDSAHQEPTTGTPNTAVTSSVSPGREANGRAGASRPDGRTVGRQRTSRDSHLSRLPTQFPDWHALFRNIFYIRNCSWNYLTYNGCRKQKHMRWDNIEQSVNKKSSSYFCRDTNWINLAFFDSIVHNFHDLHLDGRKLKLTMWSFSIEIIMHFTETWTLKANWTVFTCSSIAMCHHLWLFSIYVTFVFHIWAYKVIFICEFYQVGRYYWQGRRQGNNTNAGTKI